MLFFFFISLSLLQSAYEVSKHEPSVTGSPSPHLGCLPPLSSLISSPLSSFPPLLSFPSLTFGHSVLYSSSSQAHPIVFVLSFIMFWLQPH